MNFKKLLMIGSVIIAIGAAAIFAADHIDAPAVEGTSSDITDLYAFRSPANDANLVFAVNTQGLMDPAATQNATFDENVLIEINIDGDGDLVEDQVIQVVFKDGQAYAYGPAAPLSTGLNSRVNLNAPLTQVEITGAGQTANVGTNNGVSLFAGPRDDPFFFDFARFQDILAGNETQFRDPGQDTFAGKNVMSVVVEVPKSLLPSADKLNVWATSNTAQ